ncbi:MAG: TetR/AcrR family transcriptional regulator [Polyangiaceae bacterium]
MPKRPVPEISARKRPKQQRSEELVEAILEAALRILKRDGAERFSTVRVAKEAGVSVGSLYQYFPNKESLLFRLQADEWRDTSDLLDELMRDEKSPPFARVQQAILVFFRSERDEAELRLALKLAHVAVQKAPEAHLTMSKASESLLALVRAAAPNATAERQTFAAEYLKTVLSAVAERISDERRPRDEIERCARATSDMFSAYLRALDSAS